MSPYRQYFDVSNQGLAEKGDRAYIGFTAVSAGNHPWHLGHRVCHGRHHFRAQNGSAWAFHHVTHRYLAEYTLYFHTWHDLSNIMVMPRENKNHHTNLNKRELIRTLVLSPLYWKLKLKDRALLIRKMIPRKPN
jgi:hypothetical protein